MSAVATDPTPLSVEFIQVTRAYYFDTVVKPQFAQNRVVEEINVSNAAEGGGVHFEFTVEWVSLRDSGSPSMRVKMFYDAFAAFRQMRPLFDALADYEDGMSVEEFMDLLVELFDARDVTPTENPHIVTSERQDWQILAASQVVQSGSETQMRDLFARALAGETLPGMPPVDAPVRLRLVHVEDEQEVQA